MQGSGGKAFQTLRPISTDVLRGQQRACVRRLRKVCGIRELVVGGGEVCEGNGLRRKIGESSRASLLMRCTPTSPLPFPLVMLLCPPWQHLKVTVTHTKPTQGTSSVPRRRKHPRLTADRAGFTPLRPPASPACGAQGTRQEAGIPFKVLYFTLRMRKGNKKATHSLLFGKCQRYRKVEE